jgi:hypothetical protein
MKRMHASTFLRKHISIPTLTWVMSNFAAKKLIFRYPVHKLNLGIEKTFVVIVYEGAFGIPHLMGLLAYQ